MTETLLRTKLLVPPLRPNLVPRPRLLASLDRGLALDNKLILISAPAGFGKTTLANTWVHATREAMPSSAVAWLSLDESDNDPTRFLVYLVAALRQVDGVNAAIGRGTLAMLQSPQAPPQEALLTSLINDVVSFPHRIVLVLDDFHAIDSAPVDEALAFIIEHLPPQLHLVIVTRVDPDLPLARYRARGQLTEVRAADLRFTTSEATDFLNDVMGLNLAAQDVTALEKRTEGWITGLQLAAISLQGQAGATELIQSFSGSHRYVLDYLIGEVLSQQPESLRTFMLQTAILDRLTGGLCNAVTLRQDGQRILEMLDHANLFIVRLDDERLWYRYHHLFAELLRRRLRTSDEHEVAKLHLRASHWYEHNNLLEKAIDHAFKGKAVERAAELIAKDAEAAWERNEEITLRKWLDKLPEALVFSIPQLWMFHAWRLFITGQREPAKRMLDDIERTLNQGAGGGENLAIPQSNRLDKTERMKLQGRIETARAFISAFRGDEDGFITRTKQALDCLPEQDLAWRSMVSNSLADGYYFLGDMENAYRARFEALELSTAAGNSHQIMLANLKLAVTLRMKGQLQKALEICQQQYQLSERNGMAETVVVGYLLTIWGEALAEINELEPALLKAQKGVELTENRADVATLGFSYVWLIRVLFSCGDFEGAERVARKMEATVSELDMLPWIMDTYLGWRARLWLRQNRLDDAISWAKEQNLCAHADISSVNEAAHRAYARILSAQGQFEESLSLLQRLWERAEAGGRTSIMVETLILQALAFQAQERTSPALERLERSLKLAEPAGFIRAFVDEGQPMAHLLNEAHSQDIAPQYVRRLLSAFAADGALPVTEVPDPEQSELVEPLSERELDVLELIADGLSNRQIADRLYISLHTVKAHTRNIYGKLDVHSRTRAAARARELGVLPPF